MNLSIDVMSKPVHFVWRKSRVFSRFYGPLNISNPRHRFKTRMSVFPLKFGAALRTIVYPSGDPSGRFGLLGIGVERGEKAGQGTIPVNPPELLLGNQ